MSSSKKLLLSAVACDPFGGSEGIYGWNIVSALGSKYECHVLTHEDNRAKLDEANARGMIPEQLKFYFVGCKVTFHQNRLWARLQSWAAYARFCHESYPVALALSKEVHFDMAFHLTYTTWRIAPELWKLPIPFIWGPISGTEPFPWSCLSTLSFKSKLFEYLRAWQTVTAKAKPSLRACAKKSRLILVPHPQAKEFLSKLRGGTMGVEVCHNFVFPESRMEALRRKTPTYNATGPLKAFAAGNLEGRKGVAIALQAIALARKRGVEVHYRVTSRGPELDHLVKLSRKLEISDLVTLGERFESDDFASALSQFDLCLLPSLRDGAGLSIMEAMLAGCVPIVADWCGPAEFVSADVGYKVSVSHPAKMATEIADILCHLSANRALLMELGNKAAMKIREEYNYDQLLTSLAEVIERESSTRA